MREEWETMERRKKVENGKNEEHKWEREKAERIKENGIERKEWRTSERMENIGWIKKMRENRKQRK